MTKEEKSGESGTHTDNDLTEIQEIMQDNNLPFYHSTKQDEEDDDEQEEP